jgi:hypothetical protein
MGADLYLNSVYNANNAIWQPKFRAAVDERDRLRKQGDDTEADAMQVLVSEYYDKLNEVGYYRDSYNSTGFIRLLGLSYWQPDVPYRDFVAVAPFEPLELDEDDEDDERETIHGWGPAECQMMLDLINTHMENGTFQRNFAAEFGPAVIRKHQYIAQEEATPEAESEGWYKMFMGKYERLTSLLRQSIELGEPIHCSV